MIRFFGQIIFDHNYKMLANILFMRRPLLNVLAGWFSTQSRIPLIPKEKYENYYKPKMKQFDPIARQILQMMASTKCNVPILKNKLQNYRVLDYNRHPKGIISLIVATNECKDIQIRDFGRHMVQFMIRSPNISKFECDQNELSSILAQFAIKRIQSFEKIKQTMIKYKIAQLLLANASAISFIHFHEIINLLTNNQRLTVTTTTRFASLSSVFSSKILEFIKNYVRGTSNLSYDKALMNQNFCTSIIYYFRDYPTQNDEEAKILFQFADKAILSKDIKTRKIQIYSIHRNFPYASRSPEGEYYKDIILKKIIQRSKRIVDEGEDWNEGLLCYSILSFEFYKTMDNLQFRYEEDLNYLKKQDLKIPQLSSFYWDTYKKTPRDINKDHIARKIIKTVYPERYISTPDLESSTIKPPKITENEIKLRMISAFELLGLKWQREIEVNGRYVDFLVDDVIFECDGDYHFDLYKMDYNESTQFRNLHLLLSGYKLLIFNIFQYNRHRTTEALAQLIKRKLEYLKKNDAVMIL